MPDRRSRPPPALAATRPFAPRPTAAADPRRPVHDRRPRHPARSARQRPHRPPLAQRPPSRPVPTRIRADRTREVRTSTASPARSSPERGSRWSRRDARASAQTATLTNLGTLASVLASPGSFAFGQQRRRSSVRPPVPPAIALVSSSGRLAAIGLARGRRKMRKEREVGAAWCFARTVSWTGASAGVRRCWRSSGCGA